MTRCHQYLQTGYFGNDKPASSTSLSRLKIRWVFQDQYFCQSQSIEGRLKWIISYNIFLQRANISKLIMKLAYWPGFFRRSAWIFCISKVWTYLLKEICYKILSMHPGGNDKDLKMIRCRFRKIFNPERNLSSLFLCLFYRISLTWINSN